MTTAKISPLNYAGHINTGHDLLPGTPSDTAVRIAASDTSLTCKDNAQATAHVTLGCDEKKRLVVNRWVS